MQLKITVTNTLNEETKKALLRIWNKEYPNQLKHDNLESFNAYLAPLKNKKHWLVYDSSKVKGWYFEFDRDDVRWFAMILDRSIKNQGWGSKLLNMAKSEASVLNGWVIDHNSYNKSDNDIYKSPLNFYLQNGFEVLAGNRLETDKISAVHIKWQKF